MRRLITGILILLAFFISIIIYFGYCVLLKPNTKAETTYLLVPHGSNYKNLIDSINSKGVIKNMGNFMKAARFEDLEESVKPGRYLIKKGMSNREIIRAIKYGWQTPLNITISGNIRTKERLAALLSRKTECDSIAVLKMLKNDKLADSLGFKPETFIGMFLPNTYEFYWTVTPHELALRFKREFDTFWDSARVSKAKDIGLSPVEVITLASIVCEESNLKSEYSRIGGVYMNRLKRGIPLQADPTVKFAVKDPAIKRILFKHLRTDSPYNTYKFKGLPPGPIAIPPLPAIDSVLSFENHNYLYFCAKPNLDGSHVFASTLSEHNRNARAYQQAISRLKR